MRLGSSALGPVQRPVWLFAVTVLANLGGCPVKQATPVDVAPNTLLEVRDDDHVLAVGDPPITVIEYGDFECPICGMFEVQTYPTIRANYIDTGKVRWVYRHLPLRKHPRAQAAAEASECAAAQGKFWEYHDLLLVNQLALTDADLNQYAAELGLDVDAFAACLSSHAEAERVMEDVNSAAQLDATHTPTFYIGTQQVIGLLSVQEFTQILDAALGRTRGATCRARVKTS